MFFNKNIKQHRINLKQQKINQLKKFKLDFLIVIKFNKQFSSYTAKEFIKKLFLKKLNLDIYMLVRILNLDINVKEIFIHFKNIKKCMVIKT